MGSGQAKNTRSHHYLEIKGSESDYHAVIGADSFYSLLAEGSWRIHIKDWLSYQNYVQRKTSQIAVLGHEKTGKSFLLSKLLNYQIPQSKHERTKGLCVVYPIDSNYHWTALDTPGTNISIKTKQMSEKLETYFQAKSLSEKERIRMLFGDNILMEALLQEFVMLNAQVILIVIGKLRRDDQRLINRIKFLPGKRVMIVHNLLDTLDIKNVNDIIEEDIVKSFKVTSKPINQSGPTKKIDQVYIEDGSCIEHIIMAHDKSIAGNYFNESAIQYIRSVIDAYPFAREFDLVEAFLEHLNKRISEYFSSSELTPFSENCFRLKRNQNETPTQLFLENPNKFDLKLSFVNELGDIQTFSRESLENVPFSVKRISSFQDKKEIKNYLQIEFEIFGMIDDNELDYKLDPIGDYVQIKITGKVKDNTISNPKLETLFQNSRKFGNFSIKTEKIDIAGFTINKAQKPKVYQERNGLKFVSWEIEPLALGVKISNI